MVRLKPNPVNSFICPMCKSDQPIINEIRFESTNVLADCTCAVCNFEFYQFLPVGHTVDSVVSIGKNDGRLFTGSNNQFWLSTSLLKSHQGTRKASVNIKKVVFVKHEKVIILNTLDYLYGHVLLKLYNAFHHLDQQKEFGLIVIVPKIFEWLIPQGCAEAWVVDLKLDELQYGHEAIRSFVSHELDRFQEVHLSRAYSHPDFSTVDIARLTGVQPFNLEFFSQQKPTITFVLREDRWWFENDTTYLFYRLCRKLKILSWGAYLLSMRQNRLVKRVIKLIRKDLQTVDFFIVGLGKSGSFASYATDNRNLKINAAVETSWCKTYAQSHVVVGVHGSNMLLPTALAAGCVEILPQDRYGNMGQDLSVRYNDRRQLFFYRFADQFASPRSVGNKVVSMIQDYELYHKNMICNTYPCKPGSRVMTDLDNVR